MHDSSFMFVLNLVENHTSCPDQMIHHFFGHQQLSSNSIVP